MSKKKLDQKDRIDVTHSKAKKELKDGLKNLKNITIKELVILIPILFIVGGTSLYKMIPETPSTPKKEETVLEQDGDVSLSEETSATSPEFKEYDDDSLNYGLDESDPLMNKLLALIESDDPKPENAYYYDFSVVDSKLGSSYNKNQRALFIQKQTEDNWALQPQKEAWEQDENLWELFSPLDDLNRVGKAEAMLNLSVKPTEKRASRLTIDPTGWHNKKLADRVWLFNRSHLIGYRFTGHNDNILNLMTGTTTFNQDYMAEYEQMVADALEKGATVRYRVWPLFYKNEPLARGVLMTALDVTGVTDLNYNVLVPNVQKGYTLNYETSKATKKD